VARGLWPHPRMMQGEFEEAEPSRHVRHLLREARSQLLLRQRRRQLGDAAAQLAVAAIVRQQRAELLRVLAPALHQGLHLGGEHASIFRDKNGRYIGK
jgi:hypothetical protein